MQAGQFRCKAVDVEETVVLISVLCTHMMSSALGHSSDSDLEGKDTGASENNETMHELGNEGLKVDGKDIRERKVRYDQVTQN